MIIIIDESGEVSTKSIRKYFVLGLIKINDFYAAERISEIILDISKKTNHKTEFKFSKTKKENGIEFLKSSKIVNLSSDVWLLIKQKFIADF
jgi:hypothetical protein